MVLSRLKGWWRSRVEPLQGNQTLPVSETPKAEDDAVMQHLEWIWNREAHLNGWFRDEEGELFTGFPVSPENVVLDIGCNVGYFTMFCAGLGAEIIAADVDAAVLASIEQRLAGSAARAYRTLLTDANPIPLPDSSVDRIVATEVLEHVDDPAAFVAELIRVAKPGALFLISVPGAQSEALQKFVAKESYFKKPNHVRIFADGELVTLLESAGLVIEHEARFGFFWAMWMALFWVSKADRINSPHPLLYSWAKTWEMLLDQEEGHKVKRAFDELMPKNMQVVARKPG